MVTLPLFINYWVKFRNIANITDGAARRGDGYTCKYLHI